MARRDHSYQELIQKLANKYTDRALITKIVDEMRDRGYLSDQRFTEQFIRWRTQRGLGPLRIQAELQARGISAEMIAELLNITDNSWFHEARCLWQRHFKGKLPKNFAEKAKQMRFLQYRGFTREHINHALQKTPEYELDNELYNPLYNID